MFVRFFGILKSVHDDLGAEKLTGSSRQAVFFLIDSLLLDKETTDNHFEYIARALLPRRSACRESIGGHVYVYRVEGRRFSIAQSPGGSK